VPYDKTLNSNNIISLPRDLKWGNLTYFVTVTGLITHPRGGAILIAPFMQQKVAFNTELSYLILPTI